MKLNVYTDENLTEIKRVAEADKIKIPYRVAMYVIQSLDEIDLDNNDQLIKYLSRNIDKVDKIIKATFGVTESEMECLDLADMVGLATELIQWVTEKIKGIKGNETGKSGE